MPHAYDGSLNDGFCAHFDADLKRECGQPAHDSSHLALSAHCAGDQHGQCPRTGAFRAQFNDALCACPCHAARELTNAETVREYYATRVLSPDSSECGKDMHSVCRDDATTCACPCHALTAYERAFFTREVTARA